MSDESPTFFVLTPTYNRSRRLATAIASVQAQSYEKWRHFILDDGSSDDTRDVLASFEEEARIQSWHFDSNGGVNAARNHLLDRILELDEPGFVVILDDDDRLEKDALAGLARAIRENPTERWLIADCHLANGDRVSQIRSDRRSLCYVRDHKLGSSLRGDVAHVFHTSIVGRSRFTDAFQNAEEWWFYADLARRSQMFPVALHAKTVVYLEDGLTLRQPNKDRSVEIYSLKLQRFEPFLNRRQRASLEARLGRHLFARGERVRGLHQLACALRHWPLEHRTYLYALEMALPPLARLRQRRSSKLDA